jgi:hypothetical protein
MTDFVDDLGAELLAAARRRSRRRRLPHISPRPLIALAAVAAALAAVFLVPREPDVERPVPAGFVPPIATTPERCAGAEPTHQAAPDSVLNELDLLRRPSTSTAATLPDRVARRLPVAGFDPDRVRTPPRNHMVRVIAASDVLTRSLTCGGARSRGAGACVVWGDEPVVRCFTVAEIRAGRAFAIVPQREGAYLLGLVPDGPIRVGIGQGRRLDVNANTIAAYVHGLKAGDGLRIRFEGDPRDVLIVNHTGVPGLASAHADLLRRRLGPTVSVVSTVSDEPRRRTEVRSEHADFDGMAKQIGAWLEVRVVADGPSGPRLDPIKPKITVSLGDDRMR